MKRRHVPLLLLVVAAVLAAPAAGQEPLPLPQCSDLVDNDDDTKVDLEDPGCENALDETEAPDPPPPPQCSDGVDNDGDGKVDSADAGCSGASDNDESDDPPPPPQCSDNLDNDGDRRIDEADAGCASPTDDSESPNPECSDGADNDGDGDVDLNDAGCDSAQDNDESNDPALPSQPTLTFDTDQSSRAVSGTGGWTVYANTGQRGQFIVDANASNADTVRFRSPSGATATRSVPFANPYPTQSVEAGEHTVTAYNAANRAGPSTHFTVESDTTGPVDVSVQYTDGNDVDGTIEVSKTDGSDAQAGVNPGSGRLERRLGTLTDTTLGPTCTNLGDWTATTQTNTIGRLQCAFYRYTISDNVGNIAMDTGPAAVWFDDRDRIPPANVTNARARAGDHRVRLTYETPTVDFERVKIFRTKVGDPGSKRLAFNGTATRFVDRTVYNGTRYVYEIVTYDATGNRPDPGVLKTVLPTSRYLLTPRDGAIRTTPPRLTWKPKRRATFYNVKLVRNGRTILSAFPRDEDFKVRWRWKYRGTTRRYRDGNYFWYVWPRIGGRYGALMGWSRFSRV